MRGRGSAAIGRRQRLSQRCEARGVKLCGAVSVVMTLAPRRAIVLRHPDDIGGTLARLGVLHDDGVGRLPARRRSARI